MTTFSMTHHLLAATAPRLALCSALCVLGACASAADMGGDAFQASATAGTSGAGGTTDDSGSDDGSAGGGTTGGASGSSTGDSPGVCGDGELDPGEACDDGNLIDGDGCESDCTPTPGGCGDGMAPGGELCHDLGPTFDVAGAGGVALGDLDGDGDLDLVASEPSLSTVVRFLLDGTDAVDKAEFLAGGQSNLLTLEDLDGDGDLDLSARTGTNTNDRGWSMLPGSGTGLFGAVEIGIDGGLYAYATGNLDLDGIPDVVFSVPQFWMSTDVVMSFSNIHDTASCCHGETTSPKPWSAAMTTVRAPTWSSRAISVVSTVRTLSKSPQVQASRSDSPR